MAKGDTKTEDLLDILGSGGTSPYPRNSATKTQNYIMDAIDRVNTLEQEIEEIAENPDVADIVATYADLQAYDTKKLTNNAVLRVLADETHDGDSTYYRYNKKNNTFTYIGSIPTVEPGQPNVLTASDYNYPTNNPTSVALWLLPEGFYIKPSGSSIEVKISTSHTLTAEVIAMVADEDGYGKHIHVFQYSQSSAGGASPAKTYNVNASTGAFYNSFSWQWNKQNNLTTTAADYALDARQGKVLNDKIEGRIIQNAGAPTTATVGTVGQLLEDTTNGKLYICTAIVPGTDPDPDTYTWTEVGVGGGGSGITELTSADYDWPVDTPDGIALWKLPTGMYHSASGVKVYKRSTTSVSVNDILWVLESQNGIAVLGIYITDLDGNPYAIQASKTTLSDQPLLVLLDNATGTSTTSSMTQNAITSMVFADPATKQRVRIGSSAQISGYGVAIGANAADLSGGYNFNTVIGYTSIVQKRAGTAIGSKTTAGGIGSIALGYGARTSTDGVMTINAEDNLGYNSSNYRLLTGLYDGQSNHDAATVAQGNKLMTTAPATTDAGVLGQLWTDTTAMHTYQLTAIDTTDPDSPSYTWTQRW